VILLADHVVILSAASRDQGRKYQNNVWKKLTAATALNLRFVLTEIFECDIRIEN